VIGVLRGTGTTAILVTHDPGEAFAVSDQLAVMQGGVIMQCAHPETVYWQPASPAVARLTGAAIFLPGQCRARSASCALGALPLHQNATPPDGAVVVMVRPERVHWQADGPGVPARVVPRSVRGGRPPAGRPRQHPHPGRLHGLAGTGGLTRHPPPHCIGLVEPIRCTLSAAHARPSSWSLPLSSSPITNELLHALFIVAIAAEAMTAALAAGRREMDWLGVCLLGCITAL